MISKSNLDSTKKPVGYGVASPEFAGDVTTIIGTSSADMTNSETDLNQSYDQTNRSAQFKNPSVSQDIPEAGRNQYE